MPKYRTVIVLAYEYEAENEERAEAIATTSFEEEYGKSAHDVAVEVKTEEVETDEKWFDATITYEITLKAETAEKALFKAYKRLRDRPQDSRADVELTDLSKKIEPAPDA